MTVLTIAIVAFAAAIVVACVVVFARDLGRPLLLDRAVIVLAGVLVLRGLLDIGLMVFDSKAVHDVTHLGYLITSVGVLPLALQFLEGDRSKWATAVLGVATLAALVVVIRLEMTAHG